MESNKTHDRLELDCPIRRLTINFSLIELLKIKMSRDCLLLILTRWKNQAYELSRQIQSMRSDYEQEYFRLQQKLNQFQNENTSLNSSMHLPSIKNEDILKQLLINVNPSSISDQLTVLSDFFVHSLKTLLLSKMIEEKQRSTVKCPPIIENIEINIKQIGNLIKKMNEDCSNELVRT
jgi:hypothetical protein